MNLQELNVKLRKDIKWFDRNTSFVSIENISINDRDGQIRKNGIQSPRVAKLMEDIERQGQIVPITIDKDFVAVDGNHRLQAFRQLNKRDPNGVWGMIRVYQLDFESEQEMEDYQLVCNDHLECTSNGHEDYVYVVSKNLKNGDLNGVSWENFHKDIKNFDILKEAVTQKFAKLKLHHKTIEKIVNDAVRFAPGSKFKQNIMADLVREAGCSKITKWNGTKSKQESNGWWLMTCGNKAHIFPQLAGNSLNRKINNDNIKNTVIFNCSNLQGFTGAKLDQWRKDRVSDVNKINNADGVLKVKLVDEVLFSPHKIEPNYLETGFFKVRKKSNRNGDFDPDTIPTSGW